MRRWRALTRAPAGFAEELSSAAAVTRGESVRKSLPARCELHAGLALSAAIKCARGWLQNCRVIFHARGQSAPRQAEKSWRSAALTKVRKRRRPESNRRPSAREPLCTTTGPSSSRRAAAKGPSQNFTNKSFSKFESKPGY